MTDSPIKATLSPCHIGLRFSPGTKQRLRAIQIAAYRDRIDKSAPCWLVVFDRTPAGRATPWEARLTWDQHALPDGSTVTVVGG